MTETRNNGHRGNQAQTAAQPARPPDVSPERVQANGPVTASRLWTAEELAERWQVPKAHVYRLTREGLLPTVRLGRYYRDSVAAIEAFEAAGGTVHGG